MLRIEAIRIVTMGGSIGSDLPALVCDDLDRETDEAIWRRVTDSPEAQERISN
jgi:hypothetical protein